MHLLRFFLLNNYINNICSLFLYFSLCNDPNQNVAYKKNECNRLPLNKQRARKSDNKGGGNPEVEPF